MAASYKNVEEAYKRKNNAIDQLTGANSAAYEANREDIRDSAAATLRDLYLQNERAKEALKQKNKAAGITGGAAESASVALDANYNTNRTNTMIERDKQLSEVNIAQNKAAAQAEIDKAQNNIELESGRLSFDQDENTQRRSELWELVRAGSISQEIADELGFTQDTLRMIYNRYKED
ncbi:MAG: hypothetical protein DBX52_02900 [Clostridiales bacterium]|nr:MAG: hypothetical protein DBX52_02900 [Clostridiales bacterium]